MNREEMIAQASRHRILYRLVLLAGFIMLIAYSLNSYYSKEKVWARILGKKGYDLWEVSKPVDFRFALRTEWLPDRTGEKKKVNVRLGRLYDTDIWLEEIELRERSIQLIMDAKPDLNVRHGRFLYIWEIIPGGSRSYDPIDQWQAFGKDGEPLKEMFQAYSSGGGPNNLIGLDIKREYEHLLRQGVDLEFRGFIGYEYRKN